MFYLWEWPGSHCIGGGAGPLGRGKSGPYRESISEPSSLCRVAVPAYWTSLLTYVFNTTHINCIREKLFSFHSISLNIRVNYIERERFKSHSVWIKTDKILWELETHGARLSMATLIRTQWRWCLQTRTLHRGHLHCSCAFRKPRLNWETTRENKGCDSDGH